MVREEEIEGIAEGEAAEVVETAIDKRRCTWTSRRVSYDEHKIQLALQRRLSQYGQRSHPGCAIRPSGPALRGWSPPLQQGPTLQRQQQYPHLHLGLGFFASSLVTSNRLPFKIAIAGFILGQIFFISPLYISAVRGKDSTLSKVMPVGGGSMMVGWLALLFA
ncbi:unnamed protein product [Sphagnum balticum]